MSRILADLYNGNLEPSVRLDANDPEIRHLEKLMSRNLEKLEAELSEKGKEVMENYNECVNEYVIILTEKAFCDGFCLATRIVAEAMCSSEKQIAE